MKGFIKIDVNEELPPDGVRVYTDVGICANNYYDEENKVWCRSKDSSIIRAKKCKPKFWFKEIDIEIKSIIGVLKN